MYRPYDQSQQYLLPPSLQDFVNEDHPAHVINDLVDQMDLSVLEARYGKMGQPAYHPRLMLKVILYGFTVGIFSSRKLQRACQENLAFKFLAGMETPVFRTFIEFRQRHLEDMQGVFVQTARLARELGLARLGAVALDGSKVDANTSKHKAMSYGRMQEEEAKLKAEIEGLLETANAIDKQEDFTDRRLMGTRSRRNWRGGNSDSRTSRRPRRPWRSGSSESITANRSARRSRSRLRTMTRGASPSLGMGLGTSITPRRPWTWIARSSWRTTSRTRSATHTQPSRFLSGWSRTWGFLRSWWLTRGTGTRTRSRVVRSGA